MGHADQTLKADPLLCHFLTGFLCMFLLLQYSCLLYQHSTLCTKIRDFDMRTSEGRLRNGQRFSKIQSIINTWRKKPMSRSYTPEFKKDALRYVKEHKGSSDLHTIADNLGVPYHTLYS